MRSRSNVTKTLLEFSSVWHGVCIYWNENIHSVKPCVTPVLHPPPLSSPSPAPRGGAPSNTGAQLLMGIFTPKTEKRRGGYPFWKGVYGENFGNGKNSGGGTPFGRGFTGKFLGMGKFREGVPVLEGGLPGNFEEREKRRLEPIQNGKIQGGGTLLEGGLPEKFGIKKISYYICGKE